MKSWIIALVWVVSIPFSLWALEGGSVSSKAPWPSIKAHEKPSAATRAKEKEQRQKDIEAQIAYLKDRMKKVPPKAKMDELHTKLKEIKKNYGWEPKQEMMYGIRAIDPMLKNQNTMPKNLIKAFIQLNNDMKARDIDLIVLPLAPTPHFAAHTLVDGIGPEDEYFPGWNEMMIEMLENDVEIVDSLSEYRKEAENNMLVSWANDFHTGSLGRQLSAKKLAERLQRYDFARELKGNVGKWKATNKTKKGTMMPQRILVVNHGMMKATDWWKKKDPKLRRYELKKKGPIPEADVKKEGLIAFPGKKGATYLKPDAPQELVAKLKNKTFGFMDLKGPEDNSLYKTDMVMIGDSQLHSAIYGSGLPEFIMAEVGGRFRWGSKSWSGFSPPEIFLETVPAKAVQPRVVILAFLPKYFWHAYDRKNPTKPDEKANKYKPKPLPPVAGSSSSASAGELPTKNFKTSVKVNLVSQKPTNDPSTLDYDEALIHTSATVAEGPHKGKEIGLRYWILHGGAWTSADKKIKKGQTLKLTLEEWSETIKKDGKLAQHQIFNTTDQDLMVPIYWVTDGQLSAKSLLK